MGWGLRLHRLQLPPQPRTRVVAASGQCLAPTATPTAPLRKGLGRLLVLGTRTL